MNPIVDFKAKRTSDNFCGQLFSPDWNMVVLEKELQYVLYTMVWLSSSFTLLYNNYIDLAKPKSRARIFFGSSKLEPSALTTRLLNKAVALACPRYIWPCMLRVAPCTVIQLYGRTVVQSYSHISKFFWLDGLLLFCIIMGLRSASSAITTIPFYAILLCL